MGYGRLISGVVVLLIMLTKCVPSVVLIELQGEVMGSHWSVKLVIPDDLDQRLLQAGIQQCFDQVDSQMSTWKTDSAISHFNQSPAGNWQTLPEDLFQVLSYALKVAEDTNGAFDPTVGALVELWGFGSTTRSHHPPTEVDVGAALANVGWQRIHLDPERRRAWQPGDVQLDLSAIAKGFAVDKVSQWLRDQGIDNFLINLSGELRAHGHNINGEPWRVAIELPGVAVAEADIGDLTPITIELKDAAVATSGDYRHYFMHQGKRYSHHLNPTTGQPVPFEVASVTVIADRGIEADPLGTALIVMGAEAGMVWVRQHQLAVFMLVHDGDNGFKQQISPAFKHWIEKIPSSAVLQ